jgi:nitrogen fixation-related uncharacterized protein
MPVNLFTALLGLALFVWAVLANDDRALPDEFRPGRGNL